MERASIIYNQLAGNAPSTERLRLAAHALKSSGWEIDLRVTEAPGHATALTREAAAAGAHVVFACGGDGTLNEVVNGLVGSGASLALIRGGTGNVFAKEIGVPRSPERALRALVDGEERRFDLGIAGGRYFLLMCGIGFDASIVRRVPQRWKRLLGTASYILWGAIEILRYHGRPASLHIDGAEREVDLYWLLLGNTRSYGGVIDITGKALANDGYLDAYVFAGRGALWVASSGVRIVLRRQDGGAGVTFQRLRELEITTPGIPVQADGELFGETPMRFSVAPQALSVLLPQGRGLHLLSESGLSK